VLVSLFAGCMSMEGNVGQMTVYATPAQEADWIRNGDPIEYEDELWYPRDRIELLLDSEVVLLGIYKEVQFFVEARDVRPYNRLYTKFGKNKFRIFGKNGND